MRKIAVIALLMLSVLPTRAESRRFIQNLHPVLEWGYTSTFCAYHHFNYLDEYIGFRIDDKGWDYSYHSNAYVLASIGFDLIPELNLRVSSGFQGIYHDRRVVPLVGRLSYYPHCTWDDGIFVFAEGEVVLTRNDRYRNISGYQLGTGYRFSLTSHSALDFHVGARVVYDEPDVWDPLEEGYISERNIKLSNGLYFALDFGISLVF